MKTLLPCFLFFFLSNTSVDAADWVRDGIFSVDKKTCADWKQHRATWDPDHQMTDVEWMWGFLTALVRAKGQTRGGGMTAEDFPGEIDEICAAHPELDIPAVLEIFAVRHKLIAAQQSVNSN